MTPELHSSFVSIPLSHRGLHNISDARPENSRAAVRAALAAGYGIEIDIQHSADGQPMVFHDYDLDRLTHERGAVSERTAETLSNLPLRGGEEGVPTLPEILEIVDGRVPLLIEIKDQDGAMGPAVGPLEASVAAALKDYPGPVAVMSFNPYSMLTMAELAPEIARGLVTGSYDADTWDLPRDACDRLREIPDYDRAGCSFISHEWKDLSRPRVAELKRAGAHILCWTVKSPLEEAAARKVAENVTFEQYLPAFPA